MTEKRNFISRLRGMTWFSMAHAVMFLAFVLFLGGCQSSCVGQIITAGAEEEKENISSLQEEEAEGEKGRLYENKPEEGKPVEKTGVYICGAVNNPGVYYFDKSPRVVDLVNAAGGFRKDASRTHVNLAAYLSDGQQVRILTKKQAKRQKLESGDETFISDKPEEGNSKNDGLINLNTAEKGELMSLEGIGESKAEAVISYREEEGNFQCIEDIMKIPGIKEGIFNKIKNKITV